MYITCISRVNELRIRVSVFLRPEQEQFDKTEPIDSQATYNSFFDSPATRNQVLSTYQRCIRNDSDRKEETKSVNRRNEFMLIRNHAARACEIVRNRRETNRASLALRSTFPSGIQESLDQHAIQRRQISYPACYPLHEIVFAHFVPFAIIRDSKKDRFVTRLLHHVQFPFKSIKFGQFF